VCGVWCGVWCVVCGVVFFLMFAGIARGLPPALAGPADLLGPRTLHPPAGALHQDPPRPSPVRSARTSRRRTKGPAWLERDPRLSVLASLPWPLPPSRAAPGYSSMGAPTCEVRVASRETAGGPPDRDSLGARLGPGAPEGSPETLADSPQRARPRGRVGHTVVPAASHIPSPRIDAPKHQP